MSKRTKAQEAEQSEAIAKLREMLRPGTRVYTLMRHRSSSGMSRSIDVLIVEGGNIQNLSYWVGRALDYRHDNTNGGLKVSGCGMGMGFHLVYSLGRKLFPDGFQLAEGQHGRNGDKSGFDNDGGYALKHEWL